MVNKQKHTRAVVLAQIASGADVSLSEEVDSTQIEASADSNDTSQTQTQTEPPAETAEPAQPGAAENDTAEPGLNLSQFMELTRQNAKLELQVDGLKEQIEALQGSSEVACSVVRTAVERLGLALGSTVIGLEDASLASLCSQFTKLNDEFVKKFPVGGVARPLANNPETTPLVGNELTHRVSAARKTTKRN